MPPNTPNKDELRKNILDPKGIILQWIRDKPVNDPDYQRAIEKVIEVQFDHPILTKILGECIQSTLERRGVEPNKVYEDKEQYKAMIQKQLAAEMKKHLDGSPSNPKELQALLTHIITAYQKTQQAKLPASLAQVLYQVITMITESSEESNAPTNDQNIEQEDTFTPSKMLDPKALKRAGLVPNRVVSFQHQGMSPIKRKRMSE